MPQVSKYSTKTRQTAAEFLKGGSVEHKMFAEYCYDVDIPPTKRQVRKYHQKRGAAYRASLGRSQDNHEANRC